MGNRNTSTQKTQKISVDQKNCKEQNNVKIHFNRSDGAHDKRSIERNIEKSSREFFLFLRRFEQELTS